MNAKNRSELAWDWVCQTCGKVAENTLDGYSTSCRCADRYVIYRWQYNNARKAAMKATMQTAQAAQGVGNG